MLHSSKQSTTYNNNNNNVPNPSAATSSAISSAMAAPPMKSLAVLFILSVAIFLLNVFQMTLMDDGSGRVAAADLHPSSSSTTDLPQPVATSSSSSSSTTTTEVGAVDGSSRLRKVHHVPIPIEPDTAGRGGVRKDIVETGDFIYYKDTDRWDAAPVVIEEYKLIFFTVAKVGCTVWKQLFRRMMGYQDWMSQDPVLGLPHNPETNGLKYLYDYTPEQASIMMTSPEWTRAMMVRDPKQRFLSAFLDKALGNFHEHIRKNCCALRRLEPEQTEQCVQGALTIPGFLKMAASCHDDHWRPQHLRVDSKYWQYMDVVMHVENAANDAKRLLERVGAWEKYGATGWGVNGTATIFADHGWAGAGAHATWASAHVWKWYTPEIESQVEAFFRGDYENPLFNYTQYDCLTCLEA